MHSVARSTCMQTVSDPLFFLDATDIFAKSVSVYHALRLFRSALVKYMTGMWAAIQLPLGELVRAESCPL